MESVADDINRTPKISVITACNRSVRSRVWGKCIDYFTDIMCVHGIRLTAQAELTVLIKEMVDTSGNSW